MDKYFVKCYVSLNKVFIWVFFKLLNENICDVLQDFGNVIKMYKIYVLDRKIFFEFEVFYLLIVIICLNKIRNCW